MTASSSPSDDPGRDWRIAARYGAMLCLIATLLPLGGNAGTENLWAALTVYEPAASLPTASFVPRIPPAASFQGWTRYRPFPLGSAGAEMIREEGPTWAGVTSMLFLLPLVMAGPVNLLVFSTAATGRPRYPRPHAIAAGSLWLATTTAPVVCIWTSLHQRIQPQDISWLMSGFSVFLLVSAGGMLQALHRQRQPEFLFWLEVVPLCATQLAWLALAVIRANLSTGTVDLTPFLLGTLGNTLMLASLAFWWRAVARAGEAGWANGSMEERQEGTANDQ